MVGSGWNAGIPGVPLYLGELEIMFLLRYEHAIDEKGRMIIPARYRELLDGGGFITRGFEQNLMVLTTSHFEAIFTRINQMSLTNPKALNLMRFLFSNASPIELDKAGRLLIPQPLRDFAGLDGQAVITGAGRFFEIWSPERWQTKSAQLDDPETLQEVYTGVEL
jgi:MraZ protein